MPIVYYQIRTPDGRFIYGGDYRPARYHSAAEALARARWYSAIFRNSVEIVRFPKPYAERRIINA